MSMVTTAKKARAQPQNVVQRVKAAPVTQHSPEPAQAAQQPPAAGALPASWTEVPVHTRPGFVTSPKGPCPQPPLTQSAQAAERMKTLRACALGGHSDTLLAIDVMRLPPEVGTYKAELLEWLEQGRAGEVPT